MKRIAITTLGALAFAASATAAPINIVTYASLTVNSIADFEDVATDGLETNFDGILLSGGLSFAERLIGQSLSFRSSHDVLGLTATAAALQVGDPNDNLSIIRYSQQQPHWQWTARLSGFRLHRRRWDRGTVPVGAVRARVHNPRS